MTEPATPSNAAPPELQFAVRVGNIGPNNTDNVFSDYQKLICFHARRATVESLNIEAATGYFLFGSREGKSYMKAIDKAEAERFMVETFQSGMVAARVSIPDAEPLRPL